MNTLYISDLDGTLLDASAELDPSSCSLLNELIASGVQFTCATARTAATVTKILDGLHINAPAILMNGVAILDWETQTYQKVEYLSNSFIQEFKQRLKALSLTSFFYSIQNNELISYYECFPNEAMEHFYQVRASKFHKKYEQIPSLNMLPTDTIAYSLLLYPKEVLDPLVLWLNEHKTVYDIDYCLYPEIYYVDIWCLEIFNHHASKKNAVDYLRSVYHYDRIIGFGDNLNDLSLFEACDECYAVGNAKDPVKDAATAVIGRNTDHSVPLFIKQHQSQR